jgi:hypothetical protein
LSGKKTLTASLGRLATASADLKSHTLDGPLLLFTARNLSSELKACPTIEATHQYHTTNIHLEREGSCGTILPETKILNRCFSIRFFNNGFHGRPSEDP